ncbi:uncharacterized protein LOC109850322 [Asparagus officinalis]|nr:uncharacterized protein LOC109850322 [Asparagus officinalis]
MGIMTETSLSDIISFFKKCHCPKLEKVFIELSAGTKDPALKIFLKAPSDEAPIICDFRSLKIVKMNNFNSYKNEMELVRFFLEKASALESLILVAPQEIRTSVLWSDYRTTMQMNFMKEILANAKVSIYSTSQDLNGPLPTHYDAYCKF